MKYVTLLTIDNVWKKFQKEIKEIFDDFYDFILFIKAHTYDILAAKYGETVVLVGLLAVVVLLIMIIATKIIRK